MRTSSSTTSGCSSPAKTHRLFARARFGDHFDVAELAEQPPQPFACRRLVVNDQHPLRHSDELRSASSTYGKRSRTMYSSPIRLASTEERPG